MEETNEFPTETELPSFPFRVRLVNALFTARKKVIMRKDGTLNRGLSNLLEVTAPPQKRPMDGLTSTDVLISKDTGVWCRVYIPFPAQNVDDEKSAEIPIIFYYHGGGFATQRVDMTYYDYFCKTLCKTCQAVVISVNYRRSPEHRYPTAYDDCMAALKWLLSEERKNVLPANASVSQCFLMGDSAGGNLAHHIAVMAGQAEDLGPVKVIGTLQLFPFFGSEERTSSELRLKDGPGLTLASTDWYWNAFLPEGANRDHPASNVLGPNAPDIATLPLPPCVVMIAEYDVLKDWNFRYAQALKKAGKEVQVEYYKGGIHSFQCFRELELTKKLLMDTKQFVEKWCSHTKVSST